MTQKNNMKNNDSKATMEPSISAEQELMFYKHQYNQLIEKMQSMNIENMLKRLDCLFSVLKYSDKFEDAWVKECAKEIKTIMYISPEENSTSQEGK